MEESKEIYTYKPDYADAEIRELLAWFEARMDKLPQELQINCSSHTTQLPKTVKRMMTVIGIKGSTPTFGGYIAHLFLIRERLKQQGMD